MPAVDATTAKSLVVERQLGSGSYGTVVLCREAKTGNRCAVKRIALIPMSDTERVEAMNEATLLSTIVCVPTR